ncbi:hypothetical protein NEOLEDRAFT_1029143, partial [Neolentinus lepideus HHB14362 ss-1]
VGIADDSKGHRVYWPGKCSVTVERNVYFEPGTLSGDSFEGENEDAFSETNPINASERTATSSPEDLDKPKPDGAVILPVTEAPTADTTHPIVSKEPQRHPQRERKLTRYLRDLTEGVGRVSARPSDPSIPRGIQAPSKRRAVTVEDVPDEGGEAGGVDEYALVAETSDVEGLEPRDVREAKRRPDW